MTRGGARLAFFGALVVAAWGVPDVPTSVAAESLSCTAEADFTLTPGLSTSPSSGTFTTGGETGPLDCGDGGRGRMGFAGRYGTKDPDSCSSGGEGTSTTTFRLSDGSTVSEEVEFIYGPFQGGVLGGSFKGARTSGTFEVASVEGDCVSKPITKAHARFKNVVIKR